MTGRQISNQAFFTSRFNSIEDSIVALLGQSNRSLCAVEIAQQLGLGGHGRDPNCPARLAKLKHDQRVVIDRIGRGPTGKKCAFYRVPFPGEVIIPAKHKASRRQLLERIHELETIAMTAIEAAEAWKEASRV